MKNHRIGLLPLFCLVILLAGCQKATPEANAFPVAVTVNGRNVVLHEIDAEHDTLIGRKPSDNIDFALEKSIFAPLLEDAKGFRVPMGSAITVTLNDSFDGITLYDHLLTEDGKSYFNRMITEHDLAFENGAATLELTQHISAFLSSNSEFLKDGSIRGFRVVAKSGEIVKEYAFVIHVEAA